MIRAPANGYEAADRSVTVAQDTRADLETAPNDRTAACSSALPSPSPRPHHRQIRCAYTVSPPSTGGSEGGTRTATITTSACAWQASTNVADHVSGRHVGKQRHTDVRVPPGG